MHKLHAVLNALILAFLSTTATLVSGQCTNQVTMLPTGPMKAARQARDFVRFKYALSPSDTMLIRSHEDTETSIGGYDLGFVIKRDGTTLNRVALQGLPQFRLQDSDFRESFTTLAITRACGAGATIYFVTMQYRGDDLSAVLVFTVIPSPDGYIVSDLPMFSGGTVDVSRANPLRLKVWYNLNEGACNACETAYRITEYELRSGKPIRIRQYRTKRLYSSSQFEGSRIRFVP